MEFYDAWNYAESQQATAQQEQVREADEKVNLEAQGVKKVFLAKCWQQ